MDQSPVTTRLWRRQLLIASSAMLLWGAAPASAEAPATDKQAVDRRAIDKAARTFLERSGAPGLAIGVVTPAGARVFSYGVASKERGSPVDEGTLFEIGSISKTFTVTLAAYAAEVGALQWTASPSRYITDLQGSAIDSLTLLNLATHTTGGMPLQLPAGVRTRADLTAYFRNWTPPSPPGSVRTYANPSIGLLGVATARALKGDFAALMRTHVLEPLGLRHTFLSVPPAEEIHYAEGYTREGKPVRVSGRPLSTEAYGIRTTAGDLLRFVAAHMGVTGRDTVLRRALDATHRGSFRAGPMTQALIWEWYPLPVTADDFATGNGDAMVLKPTPVTRVESPQAPPAEALVTKTGATNGFGAYAAFIPGRRIGLVILANRNHPTVERLRLAAQVLAALGVEGVPTLP